MSRVMRLVLAVTVIAVILAALSPPAAAAGPAPRAAGASLESYTQESVLSPSTVNTVISAVVSPALPVNATLKAFGGNGSLTVTGELTADPAWHTLQAGSKAVALNASVAATVYGSLAYNADEETLRHNQTFTLSLSLTSGERPGNYTTVKANLEGSREVEAVAGGYYYSHTRLRGPVYIERESNTTRLALAFNVSGDVYSNATVREQGGPTVHTWGSLNLTFNTGDRTQDLFYAAMVAQLIKMYANQTGLQNNVSVTVNATGAVSVSFNLYIKPGELASRLSGIPGIGEAQALIIRLTHETPSIPEVPGNLSLTYKLNCSANVPGGALRGAVEASASGIPEALTGPGPFSLTINLTSIPARNVTALQASLDARGLDSPVPAFYWLVRLAKSGLEKAGEARVVFAGRDGVTFKLDSTEAAEFVFTRDNRTLISRLRLVYNGTEYGLGGEGELVVKAKQGGQATVPLQGNYSRVIVEGAFKAILKASTGRGQALARGLEVVMTNPMGEFKLKLNNALLNATVELTTLDPAQAASLLPGNLRGAVAGPAIAVSGVLRGGGEVELPLTKTAKQPALARVKPDGSVEVISNVKVVGNTLIATVPGFSTLIPIDLAEASQPPGGSTTTTPTTTTTATTTTATTIVAPTTTTTTTTTTVTTTVRTTQTQTTTTPTTTTTETTTTTRQPETTTSGGATQTATTTTTQATVGAAQQASSSTPLLVAAIIVVALAIAAAVILRK